MRSLLLVTLIAACGSNDPTPREPTAPAASEKPVEPAAPDEPATPEETVATTPDAGVVSDELTASDGSSAGSKLGDVRAANETSLTAASVRTKIRDAYHAGILRCYEQTLKELGNFDPELGIAFEVSKEGVTKSRQIKGGGQTFQSCIEGEVATWTFAIPTDASGAPTRAMFTVTFDLHFE